MSSPVVRRTTAVCAFLLIGAARVLAQETTDAIATDRPGAADSPGVVAPGVLQCEMGTTFESDGAGADRDRRLTAPQALVRLGITPRFELRLRRLSFGSSKTREAYAPCSS